LARLARIDVLVIDDWAMASLSEPERRDFREICAGRYQARSTILTAQLPVSAHRIEMKGDSMRKNCPKANS
jgi:DNA replication protein DnaC